MSLTSKKRGQVNDFALVIIAPFAIAIIFLIISMIMSDVNTAWQGTDVNNESKDVFSENEAKFVSMFDNGFMILLVGLVIAGIVGLFVIDTHPILFIVVFIAFIILFLVGAMIANSFSDVTESGDINTELDRYTFVPLIFENFLGIIMSIGGIFALALFAKLRLR